MATRILSSFSRQMGRCYKHQAARTFVSRTAVLNDDLPYHIVMGMPALSPTMESGSLAEWYVKEGDSFIAGDALAKIETDKASVDFEAQDDGVVAKLLAEAGGPDEIKVGEPIMVVVEEEEDIAAFADFKPLAAAEEPAAAEPEPPKQEEAAAAPPSPPPATDQAPEEPKRVEASPPPPPEPKKETPPPPSPAPATPSSTAPWASLSFKDSPLVGTLGKKQKEYIEKYGTTGQIPL